MLNYMKNVVYLMAKLHLLPTYVLLSILCLQVVIIYLLIKNILFIKKDDYINETD